MKRLETFYNEIAEEIKQLSNKIVNIESHDKEALMSIVEDINEYVEREHTNAKIRFLKNYFKNTLMHPVKISNYDKRKTFLGILAGISILECELIAFLYSNPDGVIVGSISKPNTNQYAIVGAIGKLKAYGFIRAFTTAITIGARQDNSLDEHVQLSDWGISFYKFCLSLDV